jgi:hypothetical protein
MFSSKLSPDIWHSFALKLNINTIKTCGFCDFARPDINVGNCSYANLVKYKDMSLYGQIMGGTCEMEYRCKLWANRRKEVIEGVRQFLFVFLIVSFQRGTLRELVGIRLLSVFHSCFDLFSLNMFWKYSFL